MSCKNIVGTVFKNHRWSRDLKIEIGSFGKCIERYCKRCGQWERLDEKTGVWHIA